MGSAKTKPSSSHGPSSRAMLPRHQKEAVPEVEVLPRCSRPEDPHLRRRNEEVWSRHLPVLRAPHLLGEDERLLRGARGGTRCRKQVYGQERRQGVVPPAHAC